MSTKTENVVRVRAIHHRTAAPGVDPGAPPLPETAPADEASKRAAAFDAIAKDHPEIVPLRAWALSTDAQVFGAFISRVGEIGPSGGGEVTTSDDGLSDDEYLSVHGRPRTAAAGLRGEHLATMQRQMGTFNAPIQGPHHDAFGNLVLPTVSPREYAARARGGR